MCTELKNRLKNNPEETLCMIFVEKKLCHCMLIAYKIDNYVWIWQARAKSGFKYSKFAFDLVKNWAKSLGVKELRMKSAKRLRRLFERKYKFKPLSKGEMVYELW